MLIEDEGTNRHFTIRSGISRELKIDQSIAHSGVCLTVTETDGDTHKVTAVEETLKKTNLSLLKPGDTVNLERCMPANGRFDGHIVQGHVDDTITCTDKTDRDGSWIFSFNLNSKEQEELVVDKGSICINGVSLTVVKCEGNVFTVTIIPYTYEHTQFHQLEPGNRVNIEFDILGKYIRKQLQQQQ